jgi:superfamily II DNA or RNA helicase
MFINEQSIRNSWQAFERAVSRLLIHKGYSSVRLVGQTADKGADVIARNPAGRRCVIQVKHWKKKLGLDVVDETLKALGVYRAEQPIIVALAGFEQAVHDCQPELMSRGISLQLWDAAYLMKQAANLEDGYPYGDPSAIYDERDYQQDAIGLLVKALLSPDQHRALMVLATGLGKTYVAAESLRRAAVSKPLRVLSLAHTNELVYQLERSFWPFLKASDETLVWNGNEPQTMDSLERAPFVFASRQTAAEWVQSGGELPEFDVVLIDEAHHVGGSQYPAILDSTGAGRPGGPFLLGLTATPWRADEDHLEEYLGEPLVTVDLVTGMRQGFLSNVDYRMFTDNINWSELPKLGKGQLTPRGVNRTLFIQEWDNAVVYALASAWEEQSQPRGIVFCGTIDHAITMRDQINALGFCNAAALYSGTKAGRKLQPYERNRILCDFQDGVVNVLCAVDILNEGVDVPDVNIIVFQRVTHSRRIFIQQLGRGLRLAPGKTKVIVLDFVSDIRRFAAGIKLKDELTGTHGPAPKKPTRITLNHTVTFQRIGGEDPESEGFLREWLDDVTEIEASGEDAHVLKFPPRAPGGKS